MIEQPRRQRGRHRLVLLGVVVVLALLAAATAVVWWVWLPSYRPGLSAGETYGVDVSAHQGRIDWSRVRADHISFAYIKATEGGDYVDSRFVANWRDARQAGVRVGAYHFFTLCTDGAAQAGNFLRTVPAGPSQLPAAVDLELAGNCHARPAAGTVADQVATFVQLVEQRIHQPVTVYASASFAHRYSLPTESETTRWIRRLLIHPSERQWLLWQANDRADIDGIHGGTDLDVMRPT